MRKKITFDYYILLFFLVSFLGWMWEVCIYLVREKRFVNRGITIGPWLPIYGAGALFLYFLLRKQAKKPVRVFFFSMIVCSVLEYASGCFLEKMWGVKWWDYSDMFLNLNGHICLISCLMFGVGGVFLVSVVIPVYTALYDKIPSKARLFVSLVLLLLFVADAAYSADIPHMGRGITYRG
ncbi:MAG: putative ABC transporter permease [Bacillus sp. (in: Bacteria)]|nr:putative ABC transporter permease [Bacillus sp. (in: firmicutes)]MCM1427784.1 putative ABC transporter permease [Eubacterium sp.]